MGPPQEDLEEGVPETGAEARPGLSTEPPVPSSLHSDLEPWSLRRPPGPGRDICDTCASLFFKIPRQPQQRGSLCTFYRGDVCPAPAAVHCENPGLSQALGLCSPNPAPHHTARVKLQQGDTGDRKGRGQRLQSQPGRNPTRISGAGSLGVFCPMGGDNTQPLQQDPRTPGGKTEDSNVPLRTATESRCHAVRWGTESDGGRADNIRNKRDLEEGPVRKASPTALTSATNSRTGRQSAVTEKVPRSQRTMGSASERAPGQQSAGHQGRAGKELSHRGARQGHFCTWTP